MIEELGPEGLRPARTLELKLPVYRPLLYTDTLHGDQINRDDMWAVSTDELNALRDRLALAEKVAEAAGKVRQILLSWDHPWPATEDDELEKAHDDLLAALKEG